MPPDSPVHNSTLLEDLQAPQTAACISIHATAAMLYILTQGLAAWPRMTKQMNMLAQHCSNTETKIKHTETMKLLCHSQDMTS